MGSDVDLLQRCRLVLARDPACSMQDIAAAVGVGRATLHRHFPTRDDLIDRVLFAALQSVETILRKARRRGQGRNSLLEVFGELTRQGPEVRILLHFEERLGASPKLARRSAAIIARIDSEIQAARQRGQLRVDLPARWQRRVLVDLIWSLWSALADGDIAAKDAEVIAWSSFFDGQRRSKNTTGATP